MTKFQPNDRIEVFTGWRGVVLKSRNISSCGTEYKVEWDENGKTSWIRPSQLDAVGLCYSCNSYTVNRPVNDRGTNKLICASCHYNFSVLDQAQSR